MVGYHVGTAVELNTALWRTANILIGTALAIGFSKLFPIYATKAWFRLLEQSVASLRALYLCHTSNALFSNKPIEKLKHEVIDHHIKMSNMMINVEKEHYQQRTAFKRYMDIQRTIIGNVEQLIDTYFHNGNIPKYSAGKYIATILDDVFSNITDNEDVEESVELVKCIEDYLLAQDVTNSYSMSIRTSCHIWLTHQLSNNLIELAKAKKEVYDICSTRYGNILKRGYLNS